MNELQALKIEQKDIEIYEEDGEKYIYYSGIVTMDNGEEMALVIPKVSLNWEAIDIMAESDCSHVACRVKHTCNLTSEKDFMKLYKTNEENRLDDLLKNVQ